MNQSLFYYKEIVILEKKINLFQYLKEFFLENELLLGECTEANINISLKVQLFSGVCRGEMIGFVVPLVM